jgi:hypothetical protein
MYDEKSFDKKYLPDPRWFIPAVILYAIAIAILCASTARADGIDLDAYADAIYIAEGKEAAVVPYGIFYPGCSWKDPQYCRQICKNTVFNTLIKYRKDRCRPGESDLDCLARRYAPIGADNDPKGLNANWKRNVGRLLND